MLTRLRAFLDQWIVSLQNYPVSHLVVVAMTIAWMVLLESTHGSQTFDCLWRGLLTGLLVLPLTLIRPKNWIAQAGIIIIGAIFYLAMPEGTSNAYYGQAIWIAGSIILSWILPSVSSARDHRSSQDITWTHISHWWTSFVQGLIGGAILWGGIAASLASIEFLFDVNIYSTIYQHIGVICMVCVGTRIWLINLQQESDKIYYPRWMRIFGQYIFLPLCVIYGLILISYGIKILATGQRPEGQLVYMVAGYVGFGLLTWFSILPLENKKNPWLSKAYRVLFSSFLVTSSLMIGALIIRFKQYGLTIDRYFVGALAAWIVIMSIGCIIWSKRRWLIGLGSFVVIAAISLYTGPLSATGSSYLYHLGQIQSLLPSAQTNTGDATKVYSSLDYLAKNYGTGWFDTVISTEQAQQLSGTNQRDVADQTMKVLGITGYNTSSYYYPVDTDYFSFYLEQLPVMDIAGYNTLVQLEQYKFTNNSGFLWENEIFSISTGGVNTSIDLGSHADKIATQAQQKTSKSAYIITGSNYKLIVTSANGQLRFSGSGYTMEGFAGYLLLK